MEEALTFGFKQPLLSRHCPSLFRCLQVLQTTSRRERRLEREDPCKGHNSRAATCFLSCHSQQQPWQCAFLAPQWDKTDLKAACRPNITNTHTRKKKKKKHSLKSPIKKLENVGYIFWLHHWIFSVTLKIYIFLLLIPPLLFLPSSLRLLLPKSESTPSTYLQASWHNEDPFGWS